MPSTELLAAEMEAFYRHYIDIFNGDDLTGFAGLFSYPWGVVSGKRGMNVINDEAGFVRVFQKMKAGLKGGDGRARRSTCCAPGRPPTTLDC